MATPIETVQDLIGSHIIIKCRQERTLKGVLNAVDDHLNVLLSNVSETKDTEKGEPKQMAILYLRGDSVISISPMKQEDIQEINIRDRLSNPNLV